MSATSFDEYGNLTASAIGVEDGLRSASRSMLLMIGIVLVASSLGLPMLLG